MNEEGEKKKRGPEPERVKGKPGESFEELTRRIVRAPEPEEGWPKKGGREPKGSPPAES